MQRLLPRLHLSSTTPRTILRTTVPLQTRALTTSSILRSQGPNGEPNAAASETTGTDGKLDPKQSHSAQKQQGEQQDGSGKHPAKTPDVQEKPTRSTGMKQEETGPEEGKEGGFGKEKR